MKRRVGYICVFLILLALFIYLFFAYDVDNMIKDTKAFSIITSITAILGVVGLIYQQSRGQELNSAQYLSNLSHEYIREKEYQKLLDKMEDGETLDEEDLKIACRCLDFFEPFFLLQKANTFAMKQMDDLFCFRFFALVNNMQVQDHEILKHCEYYANIGKLYKKWRRYRVWRRKPIPLAEDDLKNKDWFTNLCSGKTVKDRAVGNITCAKEAVEQRKTKQDEGEIVLPNKRIMHSDTKKRERKKGSIRGKDAESTSVRERKKV